MARSHAWSLVVLAVGLGLAGCRNDKAASLEGYWEGIISCGDAGGVAVAFDLESGDGSDVYDAEGLITALSIGGEPSDVEVSAVWTQEQPSGPQVIAMESSCVAVQAGGEYDMPCADFDEIGWDGADLLEASIANFLESGLDCDLTLQR